MSSLKKEERKLNYSDFLNVRNVQYLLQSVHIKHHFSGLHFLYYLLHTTLAILGW